MGADFSPLDEELGLGAGQLSSYLLEAVGRLATWMPFGRAVAEVAWFTGTTLSASSVRRLSEAAGRSYEAVQTAQVVALERDTPPAPAGPAVQAFYADGAMVPLVSGVWGEVKTLAIGTVQERPAARRGRPEQDVQTVDLSYFSRMAEHETFTRLALVETHRRGTETAGVVCAVSDGALWIQECIAHHRPDAVRILDWPHAVGYLSAVAKAVFGAQTAAASVWLAAQKQVLLHGDSAWCLTTLADLHAAVSAVAEGREERLVWTVAAQPPLTGVLGQEAAQGAAPVVEESLAYLRKRAEQVQYARFRAQQYPIGSGSVESANKVVVEARLKGAGMRWAAASVNPMVVLRTVAANDRWAEAWPLIRAAQRSELRVATTQRRMARQARRAAESALLAAAALPVPPEVALSAPSQQPPAPAPRRYRKPAPDHPWHRGLSARRRSA